MRSKKVELAYRVGYIEGFSLALSSPYKAVRKLLKMNKLNPEEFMKQKRKNRKGVV